MQRYFRGSIKLNCKIKLNDLKSSNTKIDDNKLDSLYKSIVPIDKKFNKTKVSLNISIDNILSKLVSEELDLNEKNKNLILNTFEKAFSDLLKSRKSEGKKIEKEIKNNLKIIKNINSKLIKLEDINKKEHFENYKKRIKIVLSQYDLELDDSKLYRELAIFSDKYDISEETSRINYHIEKFEYHIKNENHPEKNKFFMPGIIQRNKHNWF